MTWMCHDLRWSIGAAVLRRVGSAAAESMQDGRKVGEDKEKRESIKLLIVKLE